MLQTDPTLSPNALRPAAEAVFAAAAPKILALEKRWKPNDGAPVFTVKGRYTARGWTEWTQGFQFGSAILQFDATGETSFLELGRRHTVQHMAPHISHVGVHDHGFNNISTYGNLLRLAHESRIEASSWEREFYALALKISGAVQAARWTALPGGTGYVYSFNGPHSLFADTIRSMRALAVSHLLGHRLMAEKDQPVNLLHRLLQHCDTTARYNVWFGTGRDAYDERGRVAHESIFNLNDGSYRCPSSQQGFSPFTTWTRGQAWIILGYAEELELFEQLPTAAFPADFPKKRAIALCVETCSATMDHWLANSPTDGIPYWDTGAPGLHQLGDWQSHPADPFNDHEPVDSSAAAIAAQGFLRFGRWLAAKGKKSDAARYTAAGLTIARTLFAEPYLSTNPRHEGLLLHSVYHRPNGWDHIPPKRKVPCGESCLWGDYHLLELALLILRQATGATYPTFFFDLPKNPAP